MDIKLPDSWLRDYLKTEAIPEKIAEYVSLCGPSIEKVEKEGKDYVYSIEITTNRVDSAGIYGFAREVAAILPRFNINAKLLPVKNKSSQPLAKTVSYLNAQVNHTLCPRFTAILIRNVTIKPSPDFIVHRLKAVGVRPINNVVDISNYLMHELGQPVHTFDYDKISNAVMVLRASKKGEKVTTLDGKTHTLPGGDIVIEDGQKRLIDLAGIMGGQNSAVDEHTKNILLFVQNYNPASIRKTSMSLAQRTEAASLFEKNLDPELVEPTIRRGIDLFVQLTGGIPEEKILDLYPNPHSPKIVSTTLDFIVARLGISLSSKEVTNYLAPLGFEVSSKNSKLKAIIPSWRSHDIAIAEDIVEEVARMYGYYNLPSEIMTGKIPDQLEDTPFSFEWNIKNILKGWGGIEIYTLSLVPKIFVNSENVLRLKNPLGAEGEYLRTSLKPSLVWTAEKNSHENLPFHLFEISNIYLPQKNSLPQERMKLAGIFSNYSYEDAKGIIESLLEELDANAKFTVHDSKDFVRNEFLPHHEISINCKGKKIGVFGVLKQNDYIYYEFDMEDLRNAREISKVYQPISKYPPQIEDITLIVPPKTLLGEIIDEIKQGSLVSSVELIGVYENTRTLRVIYQNPTKTLTDKEVEKIRKKIIQRLEGQFGIRVK